MPVYAYYRIRAYNGQQNCYSSSAQYYSTSAETSAATLVLNAPTNFTATASSSSEITLTWTDNSTDETNFYIERSTSASGSYSQVACMSSNKTTYTDSGLGQSTTYYYRILAYNGQQNCYSSSAQYYSTVAETSTATFMANAPTNFTATASSSSAITLTWTDNSTDETNFYIERSTSASGSYSQAACMSPNKTTYTDSGLGQNKTYYYRIRAYNGQQNCYSSSAQYYSTSAETSAATLVLNAPTNFTATASSSSAITLTWTDNSTDETNFYIERSTSASGSYSQAACMSPNKTTYTDSGLGQNKTYYYRIRAYNGQQNCYSSSAEYYSTSAEATPLIITFSNVSVSSNTLNTRTGETSTLFFTLDSPATVTLKIIPETSGSTGTPIYEATQTCATAGAYMFTWDGKDSAGAFLADEAYLYVLEAREGSAAGWYIPDAPSGSGSISCSQSGSYNAYLNEPLSISYTVGQLSRINLSMSYSTWSGITVPALSAAPKISGSHAYTWDGRYSSGSIAPAGGTVSCSVSSLLSENVIITTGNTPIVSNLITDPYAINIPFAEFAKIKYTLSGQAKVTITVTPPAGTPITVVNGETQQAGDQYVEWTDLDPADATGKKIMTSQEGYYTITVKAENPEVPGRSSTARSSLKIIP